MGTEIVLLRGACGLYLAATIAALTGIAVRRDFPSRLFLWLVGGGLVATLAVLGGGCATLSPSEERKLGEEAAEEVERTVGLVSDPKVVGYVRQVAGRIARGWRPRPRRSRIAAPTTRAS